MTSKFKCPFCGEELQRTYEPEEYWCSNYSCGKPHPFNLQGTKELWKALIQAKQDLEIATKANDEIRGEYDTWRGAEREKCFIINWEVVAKKMYNYANNALKQIDHFAGVSKMVEHKE